MPAGLGGKSTYTKSVNAWGLLIRRSKFAVISRIV